MIYHGKDGSATIGGTTVAQITEWTLAVDLEVATSQFMGNKWDKNSGGFAKWSGSIKCLLDYVTGQKALIDKLAAATPITAPAALELINATTGPKKWSGNALLTHFDISQPVNGNVLVTFQFVGDDAVTPSWA